MSLDTRVSAPKCGRVVRRPAIRLSLAFVAMGALAWAGWSWSHPDVIPDVNGGIGTAPRPVAQAARAVNVTPPVSPRPQTTFTIRHLSASLDTNTAAATTTFAICQVRPHSGGLFYTWPRAGLGEFCSDLRPVTGAFRFTYPSRSQAVLLMITPTRPGTVHLDRIDIDEQLGPDDFFRRGTDTIRYDFTFKAH